MQTEDFEILSSFLRRRSGLSVTQEKSRLAENRLKPIAIRRGFRDVGALVRALDGRQRNVSGENANLEIREL